MTPAAPPLLEVDLGQGVRAAFTRSTGGDGADGATAGFNLSLSVGGEPPEVVVERRRAVEHWLGAPVAFAHQVHGSDVLTVTSPPASVALVAGRADALVTTSAAVAVGVMVADCVPVLLADASAGVVAAVHAGRRGVVAGVVEAAVEAMVAAGAVPGAVRAVVGPAVCGRCYEVPEALQREVEAAEPGTASTTGWGTPALDLVRAVRAQLHRAGVGRVDDVARCTVEEDVWFSHRAAHAAGARRAEGRFAAVVRLVSPRVAAAPSQVLG